MEDILAIIPARGGSKGIPGKNLVHLAGRPLIWYTINAALKSEYISRIVVSTDDDSIIEYVDSLKIPVIKRPVELAQDNSLVTEAIKHSLNFLQEKEAFIPDYFINLNPTSPFRSSLSIDKALKKLIKTDYDSIFSGFISPAQTYGMWHVCEDNSIQAFYDYYNLKPRQSLKKFDFVVYENGSIYANSNKSFRKGVKLLGENPTYIITTREESLDINTPGDLEIAEIYYQTLFYDRFNEDYL